MGRLVSRIIIFCHKIGKEDIIKVFSFTAFSTLVKMLTSLISVKIVAMIIGPTGIALLGQLNNFSSIAMTLASGGINNGITKYVSECKDSDSKIKVLLSTALRITLFFSFIIGGLMIVFHRWLSNMIMLSPFYGYVFIIFGMTIFLYALNMMLISILNGYKEFKKYVFVNIAGSIAGLCFTLSLVLLVGLPGALIAAVSFQSIMFFITLYMVRNLPWVSGSYFKEHFDISSARKYLAYAIMAFVSAATVPVSQMILRGYVISEISSIEAGWWEGLNRISNMYLMVITSSFGVYYLPRLSEIKEKSALKKEIYKAYKVIIPILIVGFSLIYLCRFIIVKILFTPEFYPMEKLFIWQLLGDFFKICSWLLAFIMLAKSMTKLYVFSEILFSILFVIIGFAFIHWYGIVGIVFAYFVNYVVYMCVMYMFFKLYL